MIDVEGFDLKPEDIRRIKHPLVGGIILFARNFSDRNQLSELILAIREVRDGLLISVDHEGGRVQRFRESFTLLPDMGLIGKNYNHNKSQAIKIANLTGWIIAKELGELGIDFSFTPVLDIDYGTSSVIGNRSFHQNVDPITELSTALHQGLNHGGMEGVGKHFPGHGYIKADTHQEIAIDSRNFEDIKNADMKIFESLIQIGLFGIMPSHVIYSACDKMPSGLSSFWLQRQLRGYLGFKGAIFSDDMSMNAAVICSKDIKIRVLMALNAGCDMVLVCNSLNDVDSLLNELKWQVTEASVLRINKMKLNKIQAKANNYKGHSLAEAQKFVTNITK
jgi:beta-N-acetylhexosaminidase|tara:strand:+ start:956 stop:1960 length:1005 start_codon:yes stop_codon:yes gene_type:complete